MNNLKTLIISIFITVLISSSALAEEKLIFATTITRHGDRTPFARIKSEKFKYKWQLGIGELTPEGIHQHFQLGKKLRARYVEKYRLLPSSYDNSTLFALSTDTNRTIMSAQSFLTGFYPPGTGPVLKSGEPALPCVIQVVPVRTLSEKDYNFIMPVISDPARNEMILRQHVFTWKHWKDEDEKHRRDYEKWSRLLGLEIKSLYDLLICGDHLYCMKVHQIPYPDGLSNEDAEAIMETRTRACALRFVPKPMAYFTAAPFLTRLSQDLQAASNGKMTYKYMLYSGHDDSLLGIMSALDEPLSENPPYASHIDFELYQDNNQYSVRVFFNGNPVKMGNDKTVYSLEEFLKIVRPCIDSEQQKCQ
jgi:acid phosphatase